MNELPNNADRYTVLHCSMADLSEMTRACWLLGLVWIAGPWQGHSGAEIHVFFDEAGKQNYLAGFYDDKPDSEQAIKWELVDNEYLCFDSGDFSVTININPEYHEDGGEFLYTVMCNSNLLEEEFAGTVGSAIIAAEKVLKAALKDKDE